MSPDRDADSQKISKRRRMERLNDRYALILTLEAERLRLEHKIEELLDSLADPASAREVRRLRLELATLRRQLKRERNAATKASD
ncbi:MAG: hypothetical protein NVS2B6_10310 [Thermoleophilaceae bacterium]